VSQLVRIYDLAPTLLDYACGGALPEAEGRSLRPLLERRPEAPRVAQQRLFGLLDGRPNVRDGFRTGRYAVLRRLAVDGAATARSGALEVAVVHDAEVPPFLVFDRARDPDEHRRLRAEDPRYAEAVDLACAADAEAELRAASLAGPPPQPAPPLRPAEVELLAALGYAGVEPAAGTAPPPPRLPAPFPPACRTP
jgi:arylsulfatase A-like enzyme